MGILNKRYEVMMSSLILLASKLYGRSIQGSIVCLAGCPALWSSSRRGLITQSTAESELLGYMECHQQAEGVAMLVETLIEAPVKRCIYGDNRSAVSLCTVDAGEPIICSVQQAFEKPCRRILIQHIPGSLVADGVTLFRVQLLVAGALGGQDCRQSKEGDTICTTSKTSQLLFAPENPRKTLRKPEKTLEKPP